MKPRFIPLLLSVSLLLLSTTSGAAPLDALLSTTLYDRPWQSELELTSDQINDRLDFLGIRDRDPKYAGTSVGDYVGSNLRLKAALTPRVGLDAALWDRRFYFGGDWASLKSWQVGGQWQFMEGSGAVPAMALRYSIWGDQAQELVKSTSTEMAGLTASKVRIKGVEDYQQQLNLIASWVPTPSWRTSLFLGGGVSHVGFGSLYASKGACDYSITSGGPNQVRGVATAETEPSCSVTSFSITDPSNPLTGPQLGIGYDASYTQWGGNVSWKSEKWRANAGFQIHSVRRDIDAGVAQAGKGGYQTNQVAAMELSREVFQHIDVLVRAQYFKQQYLGEIPFLYNVYTAQRFDKQYGYFSFGLRTDF